MRLDHGVIGLSTEPPTQPEIPKPSPAARGQPGAQSEHSGMKRRNVDVGYDENNRLTTATPPNPVPGQPAGGPYDYDWVGNRIHPPAEPNPMTYNAADQLLTWPGMHTYAYYPDGSLHEEQNAALTPRGTVGQARCNGTRG